MRSSQAQCTLSVVSAASPRVSIYAPKRYINIDEKVKIFGEIETSIDGTATWEVNNPDLDLESASLTPLFFNILADESKQVLPFNFVSNTNSLKDRSSYLFILTFESFSGARITTSATVVTNGSPLSGTLIVSPSRGTALQTLFSFSAASWVDTDLPLSYEFSYNSGGSYVYTIMLFQFSKIITLLKCKENKSKHFTNNSSVLNNRSVSDIKPYMNSKTLIQMKRSRS
jgi:hypothetical protein